MKRILLAVFVFVLSMIVATVLRPDRTVLTAGATGPARAAEQTVECMP